MRLQRCGVPQGVDSRLASCSLCLLPPFLCSSCVLCMLLTWAQNGVCRIKGLSKGERLHPWIAGGLAEHSTARGSRTPLLSQLPPSTLMHALKDRVFEENIAVRCAEFHPRVALIGALPRSCLAPTMELGRRGLCLLCPMTTACSTTSWLGSSTLCSACSTSGVQASALCFFCPAKNGCRKPPARRHLIWTLTLLQRPRASAARRWPRATLPAARPSSLRCWLSTGRGSGARARARRRCGGGGGGSARAAAGGPGSSCRGRAHSSLLLSCSAGAGVASAQRAPDSSRVPRARPACALAGLVLCGAAPHDGARGAALRALLRPRQPAGGLLRGPRQGVAAGGWGSGGEAAAGRGRAGLFPLRGRPAEGRGSLWGGRIFLVQPAVCLLCRAQPLQLSASSA